MKVKMLTNECFSLRDGEVATITMERPSSGRWFAVQSRSVQMPNGERSPVREIDLAPVEQAAVIACQLNGAGLWQWIYLSQPTKEYIGDMLFDSKAVMDRWYYVTLHDQRTGGDKAAIVPAEPSTTGTG